MKFFEQGKILSAWAEARATPVDPASAVATRRYVDALARCYDHGAVVYAEFALALDDGLFDLAAHHENWKSSQLLDLLWLAPGVEPALPRLGEMAPEVAAHFERCIPMELPAVLATALASGGAYTQPRMTMGEVYALAVPCAEELLGEPEPLLRPQGPAPAAFFSSCAWCRFFRDVAWDRTIVTVAPRTRRVKVLVATDTD